MSIQRVDPDPDCAICYSPSNIQCDCESKGLDQAVRDAEVRMMSGLQDYIRCWVRERAKDFILRYYHHLRLRRTDAHQCAVNQITQYAAFHNMQPHPHHLMAADFQYKRGLNEDWRASVQRYPEILEYFYSLVDLKLPDEEDESVRDPRLSALQGVAGRLSSRGIPAEIGKGVRRARSRGRIVANAPRFAEFNGAYSTAAFQAHPHPDPRRTI